MTGRDVVWPSDTVGVSRREIVRFLGGGLAASMLGGCTSSTQPMVLEGPVHYASLTDVAKLIEAGEISPVELTETVLRRISELDGRLHSYLTVLADDAMASARRAEAQIAAGEYLGPLHGMPIAVKDLFYTAGVRTTGGLSVRSDFVPTYDATVVARLRSAGAVVLGKLNLTEGALAGYHPDFEIPVNPWDESLAAGVSSSGSGVATAAGLCFASLGSDTGGSIRSPSAANGIVGLKPTYGRVSRHGVLSLAESLDHVGPMARYVTDVAVMFEAIAGRDDDDPTSLASPVPSIVAGLDADIRGMRVGFDRAYATDGMEPGLVASITDALAVLESLGAEIVDVTVPEYTRDQFIMWGALCAYEALQAHAATYPSRAEDYGAFFRDFLEIGSTVTDEIYAALGARRRAYGSSFQESLETVDAVLCPAGHVPSPASDEARYGGIDPNAGSTPDPNLRFLQPADLAGTPTITLPCGANSNGAPYAMQLMGSLLSERALCRLAYGYEQATDWHRRHPAI